MRASIIALCCALWLGCEGPAGPAGEAGPRGKQGDAGPRGQLGERGVDGKNGANGVMGSQGIPGDPGERGSAGPRGPAGPPGADGDADAGGTPRAYRPGVWLACTKLLDLLTGTTLAPDGLGETVLSYRVTAYTGGDADLSCKIDGGSNQSASGGGYYAGTTNAASTGSCIAQLDYPPVPVGVNEIGIWHFAIPTSGPRVTYEDADVSHPLNGYVYEFVDADCTLLVDNGSGWEQRTLANVWP